MPVDVLALGAMVANTDIGRASATAQRGIDQGIRASLLCTLFGIEREQWVWPFPGGTHAPGQRPAARMLAGLFRPLGGIGQLGTLAGAADLDPMDPGPSHTVLAATLAACVANALASQPGDDALLASSVLAGVDMGWRFRSAITGARPGVGFHSPGVYGTLAAAASAARTLGLGPEACTNALAIALTRASGLAINSAASMIGMTHFGWGALHGLEAALLAAEGWSASVDFERALATLYGEDNVSMELLLAPRASAAESLVFKRYPCNIYLNLVVAMLEELEGTPVDRIELGLPWVPHLDCAAPKDLRQARNSAQAVAAIAGSGGFSYLAFSGPPGPWVPSGAVASLLPAVSLHMDRAAPTGLRKARISVRAWRGSTVVLEAERAMQDLTGWGVEHARRLLGAGDGEYAAQALYGGSWLGGFEHVMARFNTTSGAWGVVLS